MSDQRDVRVLGVSRSGVCALLSVAGFATRCPVLQPRAVRNEDTMPMATIGPGFVLQGPAQAVGGGEEEAPRPDPGIPDFPIPWGADNPGLFVSARDVVAGLVAGVPKGAGAARATGPAPPGEGAMP